MTVSIDWDDKIIYVPKVDTTLIQSSPTEIRELNINTFRLTLKNLEDDIEGMPFLDTHRHNTEVTVGGVTLARVVEIINGYTVTFEDGQYAVNLVGANSNIADVSNVNQVSIRSSNSAGLQTVVSGSGVTEQDKLDIADQVWNEAVTDHVVAGSTGKILDTIDDNVALIKKIEGNRWRIDTSAKTLTIYDDDGVTPIKVFNLKDETGTASTDRVYERTVA